MPLPEFCQSAAKTKLDSAQPKMANCSPDLSSLMCEDEFVELLWENGQVVMQSQSNRTRKNSVAATNFSSHVNRVQETDSRDVSMPKIGRLDVMDSFVDNFSLTDPCNNVGLNAQDDDTVPWINYPIDDSIPSDYFSEFLCDISGVKLNTLSAHNNTQPAHGSTGFGQNIRGSHYVNHGNDSRTVADGSDPSRIKNNQFYELLQHCQTSVLGTKPRVEDLGAKGSNESRRDPTEELHGKRLQKQNLATSKPIQLSSAAGLMNFSHFSRPIALAKANLQTVNRLKSSENASSTNTMEQTVMHSSSCLQSVSGFQRQFRSVPTKSGLLSSTKTPRDVMTLEQTEVLCHQEDKSSKKISNNIANGNHKSTDGNNQRSSNFTAVLASGRPETEKVNETIVASSSVCSANSAGATSDDAKQRQKRKFHEAEDSGNLSEDAEDEPVGLKKSANIKGKSAKRSRAAEVHNLSERRRRDRINEKMRALQELIPNCNKVDKASMLEEAIEYLKSLQLQVQMMSMVTGLCMPPMMLPAGMQHIRIPAMPHFSQMGLGMGMGMRMGYGMGMLDSSGCTFVPVPPLHGPQYPCSLPSVPVPPGLQGIPGSTSLPVFGVAGQGFPASVPRVPPFTSSVGLSGANPMPEVPVVAANPLSTPDGAPSSSSKDQESLEMMQKTSTDDPQGRKESFEQSVLIQMNDQALNLSEKEKNI